MSDTMSKARQIAEVAFDKTQSQFQDRTRTVQERDADVTKRAEKNHRLKMARLENEKSRQPVAAFTAKKHRINPV